MIYDTCTNWPLYAGKNQAVWQEVFTFIESVDAATPLGKHILQGDKLFAQVQEYDTVPLVSAAMEMHHRYLDIHVILNGHEKLYQSPQNSLELIKDYRPASDDLIYTFNPMCANAITIQPGQFILFFPMDCHMPRVMASDAPERVKKVVIKIDAEWLDK
ncbi:MAG: YhcH/YjgK/YiaL family protein [Kiritimatiellae bacterium]|nr:YhcH/YjgK/YiaL family protein [Kiritimatiellia bacterium]